MDIKVIGHQYATSVAGEVRAQLARKQIAQQDLAAGIGMSPMALSRRVTGRIPFDVEELAEIAAFLGIPLGDLLPPARAHITRQFLAGVAA